MKAIERKAKMIKEFCKCSTFSYKKDAGRNVVGAEIYSTGAYKSFRAIAGLGEKFYRCVDNDEKGKKFNESNSFKSVNKKLLEEGCKDWNELLQKKVRELSKKLKLLLKKQSENLHTNNR